MYTCELRDTECTCCSFNIFTKLEKIKGSIPLRCYQFAVYIISHMHICVCCYLNIVAGLAHEVFFNERNLSAGSERSFESLEQGCEICGSPSRARQKLLTQHVRAQAFDKLVDRTRNHNQRDHPSGFPQLRSLIWYVCVARGLQAI